MNARERRDDAVKGNRIYFLDNLRTFMIFLAVLVHAGGKWRDIFDRAVDGGRKDRSRGHVEVAPQLVRVASIC